MSNGLNGTSGRLPNGRFAPGNPGGPGGNHDQRSREIRNALLVVVSSEDLQKVVARLLNLAIHGPPKVALQAIAELLNRVVGRPREGVSWDDIGPFRAALVTADIKATEGPQEPPDDAVDAAGDHLEAGESEGRDHASVNGRGRLAERVADLYRGPPHPHAGVRTEPTSASP